MKKHFKAISFAVISAALLIGCYPKENNLSYSDLDVAITNYNDTINFQDAQVVFLLDTVMHIVEENQTPKGTYDETILRKAKENLSGIFGDRFYVVKDTNDILELIFIGNLYQRINVSLG